MSRFGRLLHVVGTRPEFMEAAPLLPALAEAGFENVLDHSGQPYDDGMSVTFFEQLGLPEPDHHLGVGSCTQTEQTADVIAAVKGCSSKWSPTSSSWSTT